MLPRKTILDIWDDFLKKTDVLMENAQWNPPGSLMLQILQGQKILHFRASCGSKISFQIQNLECLLLVYYH